MLPWRKMRGQGKRGEKIKVYELMSLCLTLMLSIKPKWCELIASGRKAIEVRKTRPKLETPFKCYIYCTKETRANMLHLYINGGIGRQKFGITEHWRGGKEVVDVNPNLPAYRFSSYLAEGKVIGEFVCDYILEITPDTYGHHEYCISDDDLNASCLTTNDLWEYGSGETLYGWHISGLVIYDKPKELSEFVKPCNRNCFAPCPYYQGKEYECEGSIITRPPQSWCYVEEAA